MRRAVRDEQEGVDPDPDRYAALAGPYCGCDTCIVREVLDAAWPHLLAAAQLAINDERPPHHARAAESPGGNWG